MESRGEGLKDERSVAIGVHRRQPGSHANILIPPYSSVNSSYLLSQPICISRTYPKNSDAKA